jgi:ligand-binding sensor domain-containing protein/two-component sensor histidine kinase
LKFLRNPISIQYAYFLALIEGNAAHDEKQENGNQERPNHSLQKPSTKVNYSINLHNTRKSLVVGLFFLICKKFMSKKWYIAFLLMILSYISMAQKSNLPIINFSEKDGLTEKYIYTVAQDKSYMIWVGTGSGLYRFDGKKFDKIKSTIDKPGRQISNVLQNIYLDRSGKLWLSSMNALQTFDTESYTFANTDYKDKGTHQMVKDFISGFCEDRKGNMWIATLSNYWYKYDVKRKKAIQFVPQDAHLSKESKVIVKIIELPDGRLWAVSTNGLFEFFENGTIKPHWNVKNGKHMANEFYDAYYDSKRNCIWLAAGYDGIVRFNLTTATFEVQPLIVPNSKNESPASFVTLVVPKDENTIWYAAGSLGEFSISSKRFNYFEVEYKDEYSFKKVPISRFFHDRENNLWIASYQGLSLIPWQNNQIKSYPLFNSFAGYTVEPNGAFLYKGGYLITSTVSNGLLWMKPKENKLDVIQIPTYRGQHRNLKGIEAITKAKNNQIYCSNLESLFILDQDKNTLVPINVNDQNKQKLKHNYKMVPSSDGLIYMTSREDGYYVFNTKNNVLQHVSFSQIGCKDSTSSKLFSPRFEDKKGNIWFTYTSGVYCLDKKTGTYKQHAMSKAKNNGATIKQSRDIIQDKNGHYWITTIDNGIFELVIQNGKETVYNYNKQNANLPTDYCANIILDRKGMIWFGTSYGLVKFDPNQKKLISVLGQQHGFKDNGFSVAVNALSDGSIAVNHYGQLAVFNPNTYVINTKKPRVRLTSVKVLDSVLSMKEVKLGTVKLKHNENFITIAWASDVYNNANQNRFAYRMVGIEKNWVNTEEAIATYSSLEDGIYTFEVRSANNDGVWGEVTSFRIEIATPYWKSWWFYTLLALLVGGILYAFYQFKLNQVKKEESLKSEYAQQIAEIEMKALRAQMNPHFIFNSLNSIQKYILKNDSFAASQYLTKFSKLIRLILDHSNQNYILLSSEAELLKLYIEIEALRFDNQFEYELVVDQPLNTETIQIPSMIIQPYVENAIWHGLLHKETKGKLTLKINQYDENNIKVVVTDNGIGRQKAYELRSKQVLKKKSYGLQITEDRISILNKTQSSKTTLKIHDLKDDNGNALGTQVELIIPVQTINE